MNIYLGSENMSIGGTVEFIKCCKCNFNGFRLQLFADTDMVYQGVIGFVNIERKELLLTYLSSEEYNNFKKYNGNQLTERVNKIFQQNDFVFYKSKHFLNENEEKYWASICPKCESSFELKRRINFQEFIKEGGKIITYHLYDKAY